ncbi:MAG: FHA domain-containing protein [Anaerolineae bacterium]|nr:FHA domain-containing protein [Anaerolineae bacterium]
MASVFLIMLLSLVNLPALARQTSDGSVLAFPPELSQFPQIGFYFGAYDAANNFIEDLTAADVQLLENGHAVKINELVKVQPGVQSTVAIIPASIMESRLNNDTTTYKFIRDSLIQWMSSQPANTPDDYSLSLPGGVQVIREKNPATWIQSLQTYEPDFKAQASLSSLTQAIDLGTDPNPNPYMKRSILLIMALPPADLLNSLPNLTDRAMQLGIRISIWLVAPANDATVQQNASPLVDMAQRTGGTFFMFTGSEALPDYNADLNSLRYLYHVSFDSMARESGKQQLGIHIGRPGLEINGKPLTYDLSITPPNPIFLAPPAQVSRALLPDQGSAMEKPLYDTNEVLLKVLIEFPDGHPRQIRATRLFVDGELAVENKNPPFDQFRWNIKDYEESSSHNLRIEVEDMLGSTSSSAEIPVNVLVDQPAGFSIARFISFNSPAPLIVAALLVAGAVLMIVLLVPGLRTRFSRLSPQKAQLERDPLTQPVRIHQERVSAAAPSPTVPRSLTTGLSAPARLLRLSENGHPLPASAILLNRREIVLGSDILQVTCLVEDPSVSPVHARLVYADGAFMIMDNQSVAGTWINYTPVSSLGVQLEHGDMIHIGRVAFRFELSVPPEQKKARVISL